MSGKITWTVRQIPREVITAAKLASKKERKTLGIWLERVILEAAHIGLSKKQEIAKPEDVSNILNQLLERQDKIEKIVQQAIVDVTTRRPWWSRRMF